MFPVTTIVVGLLIGIFATWVLLRTRPRRTVVYPPTAPAPRPIPPAVRAELEQSPEWWLQRFHQLLRATGAESVGGEEWEISTFSGPVYRRREEGYVDCPCHNCRRICS